MVYQHATTVEDRAIADRLSGLAPVPDRALPIISCADHVLRSPVS